MEGRLGTAAAPPTSGKEGHQGAVVAGHRHQRAKHAALWESQFRKGGISAF